MCVMDMQLATAIDCESEKFNIRGNHLRELVGPKQRVVGVYKRAFETAIDKHHFVEVYAGPLSKDHPQ